MRTLIVAIVMLLIVVTIVSKSGSPWFSSQANTIEQGAGNQLQQQTSNITG